MFMSKLVILIFMLIFTPIFQHRVSAIEEALCCGLETRVNVAMTSLIWKILQMSLMKAAVN